eukprot:SAG31_NODE_2952_length_4869_cov_4.122432_4_plen_149_part_00
MTASAVAVGLGDGTLCTDSQVRQPAIIRVLVKSPRIQSDRRRKISQIICEIFRLRTSCNSSTCLSALPIRAGGATPRLALRFRRPRTNQLCLSIAPITAGGPGRCVPLGLHPAAHPGVQEALRPHRRALPCKAEGRGDGEAGRGCHTR